MHVNKRLIRDTLDNAAVFFIAVILFIGALAALSVFGGEIMGFFGFTYNSVRSVTIFFVVGAFVSWPISLTAEAIPKVLCFNKKLLTKRQAGVVYVLLATLATAIGLMVVDARMTSVAANKTSIIVISLLFSLMNCRAIILQRPEDT